jgi:hypothetical protein
MARTLPPVAAAAAVHLALLAGYVAAYHGDVSALVCASSDRVGRAPFEAVHTGFGKGGFDGQFYYVIAQNPWRRQGAVIDDPPYRCQRLLYPALAWALSAGGDPRLLLWVLPALNLGFVCVLSWLGARTARHHGRSEWWGLLLPFAVNAGMPLLRDLTDPLAVCAVAGLATAWLLRWRAWVVVLWAAAAVFAREQNAAVIGCVLAAALWRRRWGAAAGLTATLAAWAGWGCFLWHVYGQPPLPNLNGQLVGLPFAGMWDRWADLTSGGAAMAAVHLFGMGMLTVQVVLAVHAATQKGSRVLAGVALLGAALAVFAGRAAYEGAFDYSRLFVWAPLGVWYQSLHAQRRWPLLLLTPAALWPLSAVVQAWRG